MKIFFKYLFLPIAFLATGYISSLFINDSFKVSQFIEIGKFSNTHIIEPEVLIQNLKKRDYQDEIFKYIDKEENFNLDMMRKSLSTTKVHRSKFVEISVEALTVKEASYFSAQLSNAIISFTNQIIRQRVDFLDGEAHFLDKNIDVAKNLILTCEVIIECKQYFNLNLNYYLIQLNDKRNDIHSKLDISQTYPSVLHANLVEISKPSRIYKIKLILILLCLGTSLSLLSYIKYGHK